METDLPDTKYTLATNNTTTIETNTTINAKIIKAKRQRVLSYIFGFFNN